MAKHKIRAGAALVWSDPLRNHLFSLLLTAKADHSFFLQQNNNKKAVGWHDSPSYFGPKFLSLAFAVYTHLLLDYLLAALLALKPETPHHLGWSQI